MSKNDPNLKIETLALHGGQEADPTTGSRAVPIYQTSSYQFKDTDHAANLFALKEFGNIYTRIMNPTNDVLEKRVALLDGGIGALATASGQAAISLALLNIARAGDEIISADNLYGGTYNLFHYTFPRLGIQVKFVPSNDLAAIRKAMTAKTKAVYAESIGNPKLDVADLEGHHADGLHLAGREIHAGQAARTGSHAAGSVAFFHRLVRRQLRQEFLAAVRKLQKLRLPAKA